MACELYILGGLDVGGLERPHAVLPAPTARAMRSTRAALGGDAGRGDEAATRGPNGVHGCDPRPSAIVHTVQVQHLHLAQFGLAGPTLALKVQGACHTLSATSLSEVALRRTCTESIRKKSTLKTALTNKKKN